MQEENFLKIISSVINDSSLLGDDCAFLSCFNMYATCDNLVEDVHFDLKTTDAFSLGYKSIAVNLSDLASNLSTPKYILIGLSLPKYVNESFVKEFYKGVDEICNKYNVKLAGGDITSSKQICISVCALGLGNNICANRKNNTQIGDFVCTTGEFGSSALGFRILNNSYLKKSFQKESIDYFIQKHIKPEPRIFEMNEILKNINSKNIAMMDTSDGLGDALYRLASVNDVSLEVDFNKIPHNCALENISEYNELMFWGGEDYELLFIIKEQDYLKLDKNTFHKIGVVKNKIDKKPVIINYGNQVCDIIDEKTYKKKVFNHFEDK